MKKSCLVLLAFWALNAFGYHQLLTGTSLDGKWGIPLLLGLSAALVLANAQGIYLSLAHLRASKRNRIQWREGDLVVLSGRLQALGTPITAPISGKAATIVEYELTRTTQSGDSQTSIADYRGCLMVPCAIQGTSGQGQVQIVGFPLLSGTDSKDYNDAESYMRTAKFLLETPTSILSSSPLAAIAELNKILKDDDGLVQSYFRNAKVMDLYNAKDLEPLSNSAHGSEDDRSIDPDDQEFLEEINKFADSKDPSERIVHHLQAQGYHLKENSFENGCEVTIMGSYRSQKRQVNIGSGLSNLSHGIHRGPASKVLGKNLTKAMIFTVIFLGVFIVANYFILKEVGIEPEGVYQKAIDSMMNLSPGVSTL